MVFYGPEMNRLAVLWSAQPDGSCFAALAEALRKRGALEQATAVAAVGVAARPDYLPGRLVMAWIYRDQGQREAAEAELRAAMAIDPTHPVVLESLADITMDPVAPFEPAVTPMEGFDDGFAAMNENQDEEPFVFTDDDGDAPKPAPVSEPVLTESLAMLYRGQGHLEQAVEVLERARRPCAGQRRARCPARRRAGRTRLRAAAAL